MGILITALKIGLPLVGIIFLTWLIKKIIPETGLTGTGCGGG